MLIKKISKIYYFTLFKLFKFDFENLPNELINKLLEPHGLTSFHHRLIIRILVFTAKLASDKAAPIELKDELCMTELNNIHYNLRSNKTSKVLPNFSRTKFGGLMFKNKFGNIINKLKDLDFYSDLKSFKTNLFKDLDQIVNTIINSNKNINFDMNFKFFYAKN